MDFNFCKEFLLKKVNAKYLKFTKRCNSSIDIALNYAKNLGYTKLAYPYEGGWIHYKKACQKLKFEEVVIKTNNSLVDLIDLSEKLDKNTIFIYHTLGGYFAKNDCLKIKTICEKNKSFLVADISGAIGLSYINQKYKFLEDTNSCDFLVCSFGFNKPVNFGTGGFIASNFINLDVDDYILDYKNLKLNLNNLEKRMKFLNFKNKEILKKINTQNLKIISDEDSLVIIILFFDDVEKQRIIKLCDDLSLDYTICPREIRIKKNAISIEIKREKEEN